MKEYTVLEIKCEKTLTCTAIYEKIRETVKYNSNFFALQDLNFDRMSSGCRKLYDEINLDKFFYKKVLPHLVETSYYQPERDDRRMISNMDDRWEWYNEKENSPLSEQELATMVAFLDKLKSLSVSTLILGFDEIEWNGQKVGRGTYGYKKADCTYEFSKNYLSNSVTIGRAYDSKNYTVYLSCESRFRELEVIEELIAFLGEKKSEIVYYAPENEQEREEWDREKEQARSRFEKAVSGLASLPLEEIEKWQSADESLKINIPKYIKNNLCTDGWEKRKALPDEWPTTVHKPKEDADICLAISSGHNGHHLQTLVYYRSKKFFFGENIQVLSYNSLPESDMEKYFHNVKIIRDYLYEAL